MRWETVLLMVVVSLAVGISVEAGSKKFSYGVAAFLALGMILTLLAIIASRATP